MLERSDYRCAHRNDLAASFFGPLYRPRGYFWNAIRFVQRKQTIQFFVAGGRDTGGVSDRLKLNRALSQLRQHMPIKCETCRWRFEGYWGSGNSRPNIPERQLLLHVSVLDWSTVMGQPGPHLIGSTCKSKHH